MPHSGKLLVLSTTTQSRHAKQTKCQIIRRAIPYGLYRLDRDYHCSLSQQGSRFANAPPTARKSVECLTLSTYYLCTTQRVHISCTLSTIVVWPPLTFTRALRNTLWPLTTSSYVFGVSLAKMCGWQQQLMLSPLLVLGSHTYSNQAASIMLHSEVGISNAKADR